MKVKSMQRSGTEAIRTQIQPSKPKREITNITNSQNTKRTYGQQSEQLFPKRWPLSNRNRTKDMNTRKVKRHRNSDTKKQSTQKFWIKLMSLSIGQGHIHYTRLLPQMHYLFLPTLVLWFLQQYVPVKTHHFILTIIVQTTIARQ